MRRCHWLKNQACVCPRRLPPYSLGRDIEMTKKRCERFQTATATREKAKTA